MIGMRLLLVLKDAFEVLLFLFQVGLNFFRTIFSVLDLIAQFTFQCRPPLFRLRDRTNRIQKMTVSQSATCSDSLISC